jgi:hypothetical protein
MTVMLALYDLCAVLSPCGPLKALVNLMQEKGSPEMPGLLYEAQLPAGTARPYARSRTNNANDNSSNDEASDESSHEEDVGTSLPEDAGTSPRNTSTQSKFSSRKKPPPPAAFGREQSDQTAEVDTPLTSRSRATIPLALAKLYKLKLTSGYGTSSSRRRGRSYRRSSGDESASTINESPLLADAAPEEFYQRSFTASELLSHVEVEFPPNGGWIEKITEADDRREKYNVFGRNGELRRTLIVSKKGKVYEVSNDDDDDESQYEESSSIRLGLVSSKHTYYSFVKESFSQSIVLT